MSTKFSTDYLVQLFALHKLTDGQSTDRNNQTGSKDFNFVVHPGRTVENFIGRRYSIGPSRRFSRETSADRGKINLGADFWLGRSAKSFEPAKKRLAGSVSKWPLQCRFARAGCLSDYNNIAENRTSRNGRRLHPRTAPASS